MRSENRKEYGVIAVTAFAFALTNERTALVILAASLVSLIAYDFVCEKLQQRRRQEAEKEAAKDATLYDEDTNLYHGSGAENEDDYEEDDEPCYCADCLANEESLKGESESESAVTGEEEIGQR